MTKYRRVPYVVVAHEIGRDNWPDEIWEGVKLNQILLHMEHEMPHVSVIGMNGLWSTGFIGDYVIRGENYGFYVISQERFNRTYERVD